MPTNLVQLETKNDLRVAATPWWVGSQTIKLPALTVTLYIGLTTLNLAGTTNGPDLAKINQETI